MARIVQGRLVVVAAAAALLVALLALVWRGSRERGARDARTGTPPAAARGESTRAPTTGEVPAPASVGADAPPSPEEAVPPPAVGEQVEPAIPAGAHVLDVVVSAPVRRGSEGDDDEAGPAMAEAAAGADARGGPPGAHDPGEDAAGTEDDAADTEDDAEGDAEDDAGEEYDPLAVPEGTRPVPGAAVEVRDGQWRAARAMTGPDGVARFHVPVDGRYTAVVRAEGFGRGMIPYRWDEQPLRPGKYGNTDRTVAHLTLRRAREVAGRVVADEDGRPLAGAAILSVDSGDAHGGFCGTGDARQPQAPVGVASTDAAGRFRIVVNDPARDALHVLAAGRIPVRVDLVDVDHEEDGTPRPPEIRLARGASLHGLVTRADGTPLAGARVIAIAVGAPGPDRVWGEEILDEDAQPMKDPFAHLDLDTFEFEEGWHQNRPYGWVALRTRTDAAGRYVLHGLRPRWTHAAYATAPHMSRSAPANGIVAPAAGLSLRRDFTLRPAAALTLRAAEPLAAGAEARLEGESGGPRVIDLEYLDRATFEALPAGRYALTVRIPEFLAIVAAHDLVEGERREVTLAPSRGSAIDGVVVDHTGAAVAGVSVAATPSRDGDEHGREGLDDQCAETDDAGAFRVAGLRAGVRYALSLTSAIHETVEGGPFAAPASGVCIVVRRPGGLRFRAVAAPGVPLPVHAEFAWTTGSTSTSTAVELREGGRAFSSDEEFPGPGVLVVAAPGCAIVVREYVVPAGEVIDLGEVVLAPGRRVEGRLVDADGGPLVNLRVQHRLPDRLAWTMDVPATRTDRDGRFALDGIPPEGAALSVFRGTEELRTIETPDAGSPGESTWTVVLPAEGESSADR